MSEQLLHARIGRLTDVYAQHDLLRSTARLARLTFTAAAASIFLYDEAADALRFEAASGIGEDRIIGRTVPIDQGLAGWVFQSGESLLVSDVSGDPRFSRGVAEESGYLPTSIAAAPVICGRPVGVVEVLDPDAVGHGRLDTLTLLTELADHLAAGLTMYEAARRAVDLDSTAATEPWHRLELTLSRTNARESEVLRRFVGALDDLVSSCYQPKVGE
ncbi:MAG: GAF domain-containing protein [Streptosporangiaceae bacterium]